MATDSHENRTQQLQQHARALEKHIRTYIAQGQKPGEIDPRLVRLAKLLDEAFVVPGTSYRVGLDGLIGLIPVVGDLITAGMSMWIQAEAHRLELPWHQRAIMGWHTGVDFVIGAVPLVGDMFDFVYKANMKNLRILEKHVEKMKRKQQVEVDYEVKE